MSTSPLTSRPGDVRAQQLRIIISYELTMYKSRASSPPYLDVITIRSSRPSSLRNFDDLAISTTFPVGNTNSTKVTTSAELINTNLLVEPIIFPDLSHVDVGVIVDQEKQNWFYPSGGKRVNMRDEIERTLRNCSQTVESEYEIL